MRVMVWLQVRPKIVNFFFTWLNSFISVYMGGIIHSQNYNTYSISHNSIKKIFQTYKLNELHSEQLYTHLFDSTVNKLLHLLYLIFAHPEWINRQMYTKRPSCHENTVFSVGLNFRKGNQYYLRFTSQEMMVNLKFSLCREAWKPEFSKKGKEEQAVIPWHSMKKWKTWESIERKKSKQSKSRL